MFDWVSPEMIALWEVLGSLLGTLLLAAGTLWAGGQVAAQVRRMWGQVRGVVPDVVAAVDEPSDALTLQLGRLTHIPAGVWAAFLLAFIEALADGLDRALADGERAAADEG